MNIKVVLLRGRETIAEHRQISNYTSQSGGSNIGKTSEISNIVKSALQKVHKYNGTAYRALEIPSEGLTSFLNKYAIEGSEVTFDEFLSCGSTQEAAFFNKPEKNIRIIMEVNDAPDISSFADGIKLEVTNLKNFFLTKEGSLK